VTQLTIKGQVFEVEDDTSIVVGAPLTEGQVSALQQTRRENIRNNMSKKVEEALNGSSQLSDESMSRLQALVDEYAGKYEFGVRQPGAPRVTDPVEKEARAEAAEVIKAAYYARKGERVKGEALTEAVNDLMEARGEEYRAQAREKLARREKASEEMLRASGLAA
jgi:hypothetical protein